MSLPYFTRGKRAFDRGMPEGHLLILLPDAIKRLGPTRSALLERLPETHLKSLLAGLQFAMGNIARRSDGGPIQGDVIWQEIVEATSELLQIVVPLGKADALYELYLNVMEPLAEAQQELFNWDDQIKSLSEADVEVRYNAYMGKYMTLYEGLVKATIALPVYCLDVITNHKDLEKKGLMGYVHDDLSYKQSKVLNAGALGLRHALSALLTGVESPIRNSIAHKRFEYTESGNVTFLDVDRKTGSTVFRRTMSLPTFEILTTSLEVNFRAQGAALTLFPIEYGKQITIRRGVPEKPKALKAMIYHLCQEVRFEPTEILLEGGHLACKLFRSSALDNPSSIFGNLGGHRFWQDLPPLPLRDQLIHLAVRLAELRAQMVTAHLQAVDARDAILGYVRVDLAGLTNAMAGPPFPPLETFILESEFGQDASGKSKGTEEV